MKTPLPTAVVAAPCATAGLMSGDEPVSIVIVGTDTALAETLRQILAESRSPVFEIECVGPMTAAVERLRRPGAPPVAAILWDLESLEDDNLEPLEEAAPGVPVVILTEAETEDLAALRALTGGCDYLRKDRIDPCWLRNYLGRLIEDPAHIGAS